MRLYQISLSLCLAVTAITTTPVFAKAPANTQPILQHDIIDKNLVNEWVQYKFLYMKIEQEGTVFQNNLPGIIQNHNEQAFKQHLKETDTFLTNSDLKIQALQFSNPSMQKLLKLYHENIILTQKVIPKHYALIFYSNEDQKSEQQNQETENHLKEFMKLASATEAVKQQEMLIEVQVWQYLKDHPL